MQLQRGRNLQVWEKAWVFLSKHWNVNEPNLYWASDHFEWKYEGTRLVVSCVAQEGTILEGLSLYELHMLALVHPMEETMWLQYLPRDIYTQWPDVHRPFVWRSSNPRLWGRKCNAIDFCPVTAPPQFLFHVCFWVMLNACVPYPNDGSFLWSGSEQLAI